MRFLHISLFVVGALLFLLALLDLWHIVRIGDGVIIWRAGVAVMLLDIGLILLLPTRGAAGRVS